MVRAEQELTEWMPTRACFLPGSVMFAGSMPFLSCASNWRYNARLLSAPGCFEPKESKVNIQVLANDDERQVSSSSRH